MMISPEYEKLLIKRMNDLHEYLIRGIMLRHELWHSWQAIEGEIGWEISHDRYVSISEAVTYINYNTGEFAPREGMSFCPTPAEHAYTKLKQVVRLQNALLKIPASEILNEINVRLKTIKEMIEKMRSAVGENTANDRLKELLNAYPHLKNTFPIKGVNEMNFDMKICYLDANTYWQLFDTYTRGLQKRKCGMYDDIVISYAEQRLKKEGANDKHYHVSMKPKYTYNVTKNGKLIQGWGEEKITEKTYYKGEYLNGMKNGYGELYSEKNYWYRGSFVNEIQEGYGVCFYENGDCYEGWWKANDWHGYGSLYKADGKVLTGLWEHNSFIRAGYYEEPLRVPNSVEKAPSTTPISSQKPAYSAVNTTFNKTESTTATTKTSSSFTTKTTTPITNTSSYSSTKTATAPQTVVSSSNSKPIASYQDNKNSTIKKSDLGSSIRIREETNGFANGFSLTKSKTDSHVGEFAEVIKFNKQGLAMIYYTTKGFYYLGVFKDNKKHGVGVEFFDGTAKFGVWENDKLVKEIKKFPSLEGFELQGNDSALAYEEVKEFNYSDRREIVTVNQKGEKIGCGLCLFKDGKKYLGHYTFGSTGTPLMAGLGIIYYPDGSYYVGSVFNCKAYGIGMKESNGTYLCGKWSFDKFKG